MVTECSSARPWAMISTASLMLVLARKTYSPALRFPRWPFSRVAIWNSSGCSMTPSRSRISADARRAGIARDHHDLILVQRPRCAGLPGDEDERDHGGDTQDGKEAEKAAQCGQQAPARLAYARWRRRCHCRLDRFTRTARRNALRSVMAGSFRTMGHSIRVGGFFVFRT